MESAPYFHAIAVFKCRKNRLYRIYLRPHDLVFVWAGNGGEGFAGAAAVTKLGGLNALLGGAMKSILDPSKKNQDRRYVLDSSTVDQLAGDHPKNFTALIADVDEVRIGPRSDLHARLYSDHQHQALLHLQHRTLGTFVLGIQSVADTQIAMSELPRLLGRNCHIEIPTPTRQQKCGCAFCRFNNQ